MVGFISGLIAFMTWLMLGFAQDEALIQLLGTIGVFAAVGATLLHYVLNCMRRHCAQLGHRHDHGPSPTAKRDPQLNASG